MANKVSEGGVYGYHRYEKTNIAVGSKLKTLTFTPEDVDLHDISKEGILISHVAWTPVGSVQSRDLYLAFFNRTSSVEPVAHATAASWRDSMRLELPGTSSAFFIHSRAFRDLTSLPGGGFAMIADFISISFEVDANIAGNALNVELELYYKWVPIDSDSYRSILYARSI